VPTRYDDEGKRVSGQLRLEGRTDESSFRLLRSGRGRTSASKVVQRDKWRTENKERATKQTEEGGGKKGRVKLEKKNRWGK